ncbi:hypothetical protein GCM10010156_72960 [Planobispora rosea]|uniref:Uncharacterized protein n=1 Tax=Planobispora rosea TaxID=35762 RepID=A0A8J3WHN6_PLARO|nr:hypothetical protein [Planobispora rosea]GGT04564.1 hypothetical protein GCM10010156_72960 [Planobispora rosea]GIH88892.1 hypothetical protein Pro02_73000 [Planobispora rosea]
MRNLIVSDAVAVIVDLAQVSVLADPLLGGPQACPRCEQDMAVDGAATVVVRRFADGLHLVRIAHPACLPSAVFDTEIEPVTPDDRHLTAPASARPTLFPLPGGADLPLLVVSLHDRVVVPGRGVSPIRLNQLIMTEGLQLVTGPATWLPQPAPGWRLLAADGWATLTAADASVVYDGELALWPAWRRAALACGWVWLCVGVIGLSDGCDIGQELRAAMAAELLATGLVETCFPGPVPHRHE